MGLNIIEQLLKAKHPKRRWKTMLEMHQKNVLFFKKISPNLSAVLEQRKTGRFHLEITRDFLEIIDSTNNQTYHPPGRLLDHVRKLGHWHHNHWIDKMEVLPILTEDCEHGEYIKKFVTPMSQKFSQYRERVQSGELSLPRLPDGRRYSGSTAFIGVGSGLHIAYYLGHTQVRDIIMIEPDMDSFCLSTFFLDYKAIDEMGRFILHVGDDLPDEQLTNLFTESFITARPWLRVLASYPSPIHDKLIYQLHLRWRALTEILVPFDREVRNLCYGMRNVKAGLPLLHARPTLSENSRIALVASGPSLTQDLDWLKANQDKLIIVAAHSSVKVLRQHNIQPDFQCTLDTELDEKLLDKLDLDPNAHFVCYYKSNLENLKRFKSILLFNEFYKANAVKFEFFLANTHPTSGNVAVALTAAFKPKQIFLIGLDLGFRDVEQPHVKGHWAEGSVNLYHGSHIMPSVANFKEHEGEIYTQAYFNSARIAVEFVLQAEQGVDIYNLSDGVRLAGAQPRHSQDITLSSYPEKQDDLQSILDSFKGEGDRTWNFYRNPGKMLLDTARNTLYEHITLKKFTWLEFTQRLDHSVKLAQKACQALEPGDGRIEAYSLLFQHLLTDLYRFMIFTKTPRETEEVYRRGLETLKEVLDTLTWPDELDNRPESCSSDIDISNES